MDNLRVAQHTIGAGFPCFVIAEAGVNHNGNIDMAYRLVDVAVQAGADAVKFQTFDAEALASDAAPKAAYQKQTTAASESQLDMLKKLMLPASTYEDLARYCHEKGILFLSTPFEEQSADFLAQMGMVAFKVPSGEITNLPFLRHIARKQKPMIISTGMSTLGEVETALQAVYSEGNEQVALLHCVSNYPTAPIDVNLRAMHTLQQAFQVPVGFSDHTLGVAIALGAVALGASIIEKHFTLSKGLEGPDHQASLEPQELEQLIADIRAVEQSLGDGIKRPRPSESAVAEVVRKSIAAKTDIPAGVTLTDAMVVIKRPATGIPPALMAQVLGRQARETIRAGTPLQWDMLA